ncbi:hypothetical protein HW555_014099, partial [Spodoptera exigua]
CLSDGNDHDQSTCIMTPYEKGTRINIYSALHTAVNLESTVPLVVSESEDIEDYVKRKIRKIEKKLKRHRQRSSSQDSLKIIDEPLRSDNYESHLQPSELPLQAIENIQHDTDFNIEEVHPPNDMANTLLESADVAHCNVSSEPVAHDTATAAVQEVVPLIQVLLSENCKNINAPLLNQEVRAALTEALSKKDKAIENKQKQIALIITCLGEALSQVLSTDSTNIKLLKSLTDAGKLACDLQHSESMIRRSFVCSSIKKEIKDHLYTTPIDSHLFGSQLGDVLKAAKAIHKTGTEMKTGAPIPGPPRRFTNQPQNLNTRRPVPSHGRQTGAAARHSTMPAQNGRQNYQRQHRRAPPQQQPRGPYKRSQTQAPLRR